MFRIWEQRFSKFILIWTTKDLLLAQKYKDVKYKTEIQNPTKNTTDENCHMLWTNYCQNKDGQRIHSKENNQNTHKNCYVILGRVKLISSLAGPARMSEKSTASPHLIRISPHVSILFSLIIKFLRFDTCDRVKSDRRSICYIKQKKHSFGICFM